MFHHTTSQAEDSTRRMLNYKINREPFFFGIESGEGGSRQLRRPVQERGRKNPPHPPPIPHPDPSKFFLPNDQVSPIQLFRVWGIVQKYSSRLSRDRKAKKRKHPPRQAVCAEETPSLTGRPVALGRKRKWNECMLLRSTALSAGNVICSAFVFRSFVANVFECPITLLMPDWHSSCADVR